MYLILIVTNPIAILVFSKVRLTNPWLGFDQQGVVAISLRLETTYQLLVLFAYYIVIMNGIGSIKSSKLSLRCWSRSGS